MAREKRDNNFNIIRFVAAIMVMAGHMAYIGGYTLPTLWGEGIQALGVKIFFLIGGFLIAKSWESDSNPVRYMTKRVFRIFPALIAFTLVATYVIGPILSTLTINEYFQSPLVRNYLRNILSQCSKWFIMDSAYRIRNVYFGSDYFDSCRKKKGEEIFFCFCFCDYRCIMLSTNGKTFVSS